MNSGSDCSASEIKRTSSEVKRVAEYWRKSKDNKESKDSNGSLDTVTCLLCPKRCNINSGSTGACRIRKNDGGALYAQTYGLISSAAIDPIEKKPLYHFHSGSRILSIGSIGCNFHCPFCQNYTISLEFDNTPLQKVSAGEIASMALGHVKNGNIGVAYTYNEPLINFEFLLECCKAVKNKGLMNVLVTNGYINKEPLLELLPYVDAMNIDIKGDDKRTYNIVSGTLEIVRKTIELSCKSCHIEVTTLAIPQIDAQTVKETAKWLAELDKDIPYHISRFFPRYKYANHEPTPIEKMYKLKESAEKYLNRVYLGNV